MIAASVDDRTPQERGEAPRTEARFVLPKSRYGSVSAYIAADAHAQAAYNDLPLVVDEGVVATLTAAGMDTPLARHFAHLFTRDPLVLYREILAAPDAGGADHFENIQSTNWQTMRFKPPPPGSSIGWRVEFRAMEVQTSDFENAAYTLFIVLLSRAILSFRLNLYLPLSRVDANMAAAQQRGAATAGRFYFRRDVTAAAASKCAAADPPQQGKQQGTQGQGEEDPDDAYELMTLAEIVNGRAGGFPGLVPLVELYLNSLAIDVASRRAVCRYLRLVSLRASGEAQTTAAFIRDYVAAHPAYRHGNV